jgi:hypothetical protein
VWGKDEVCHDLTTDIVAGTIVTTVYQWENGILIENMLVNENLDCSCRVVSGIFKGKPVVIHSDVRIKSPLIEDLRQEIRGILKIAEIDEMEL